KVFLRKREERHLRQGEKHLEEIIRKNAEPEIWNCHEERATLPRENLTYRVPRQKAFINSSGPSPCHRQSTNQRDPSSPERITLPPFTTHSRRARSVPSHPARR